MDGLKLLIDMHINLPDVVGLLAVMSRILQFIITLEMLELFIFVKV